MKTVDIEDIYGLSPLQQGMLFHTIFEPESQFYFEQLRFPAPGLNIAAFQSAWRRIIERHAVLRTSFHWEGLEKPVQVVHRQVELPFEQIDWRQMPAGEQRQLLEQYLEADRRRGFQAEVAPLTRVAAIQVSDELWQIVWSFHHLLLDGWSLGLLQRELATCYEAACSGAEPELNPTRPFGDFIEWLGQQNLAGAAAYWRRTLAGFTAPSRIQIGNNDGAAAGAGTWGQETLKLDAEASAAVQSFARKRRLTLNTVIQGAWAFLIGRYSGEDDVVFGAVVSGRPADLSGVESMIGMFINTLPVRVSIRPEQPLGVFLEQLQARQFEARQYEYSPLVEVQAWSELPRRLPLFESVLVVENYPTASPLEREYRGPGSSDHHFFQRTNYPLALSAYPGREVVLNLDYDAERFDPEATGRLMAHLRLILEMMCTRGAETLSDLPQLLPAERRKVLLDWNQTDADYRAEACLHGLFKEQAARTPGAVALNYEGRRISYRELDERSNRLARHLQERGVSPGRVCAICLERSPEVVAAILAVLKTGAAYVPLDPAYPQSRLEFLTSDSGACVLLTRKALAHLAPKDGPPVVFVDDGALGHSPAEYRQAHVRPTDVAAVIYTSGSTGTPKGVLITHQNFVNRLFWMWRRFPFGQDEMCCQKTALTFVDSVAEIFGPLLQGVESVIIPDGVLRDVAAFTDTLAARRVTRIVLVPSLLREMLRKAPDLGRKLPLLRYWVSSGETLRAELAREFRRSAPHAILLNLYGSSEVAADATWYEVCEPSTIESVPIGRPIANTRVYVLDRNLQPVPIGVPGDLYVAGDGVALGYLNHPELTAASFVADPFSPGRGGGRMFRTGDRVRYLPDGNLVFLGRTDHQIKFHGFRIEPGEIEAALNRHPAVRQSVVVLREISEGDQRLIAYLLLERKDPETLRNLRQHLEGVLPAYMLPAKLVPLDQMPLNASGKLDRLALPDPDLARPEIEPAYVQPRSTLEESIAAVWREVLAVDQVGVNDNFFDLGGHSLLMVRLQGRIKQTLQREIPIVDLFRYPTIASLASALSGEPEFSPAIEMAAERADKQKRALARQRELLERKASNVTA